MKRHDLWVIESAQRKLLRGQVLAAGERKAYERTVDRIAERERETARQTKNHRRWG